MEVKIVKSERGATILNKLMGFLFGIFLTSIIFAFSIKLLEEIGLYLGLGICTAATIFGFYYTKPRSIFRMTVWGILSTLLFGIIFYTIGLMMLSSMLKGL